MLLAQERRPKNQALHDELTGLPNRQLLQLRLRLALESAARDGRMVRAIIEMGRALNLEVMAEGVEDAEAARLLTDMGADTLQGYHFSRPLTPEALPGFIEKFSGASPG